MSNIPFYSRIQDPVTFFPVRPSAPATFFIPKQKKTNSRSTEPASPATSAASCPVACCRGAGQPARPRLLHRRRVMRAANPAHRPLRGSRRRRGPRALQARPAGVGRQHVEGRREARVRSASPAWDWPWVASLAAQGRSIGARRAPGARTGAWPSEHEGLCTLPMRTHVGALLCCAVPNRTCRRAIR